MDYSHKLHTKSRVCYFILSYTSYPVMIHHVCIYHIKQFMDTHSGLHVIIYGAGGGTCRLRPSVDTHKCYYRHVRPSVDIYNIIIVISGHLWTFTMLLSSCQAICGHSQCYYRHVRPSVDTHNVIIVMSGHLWTLTSVIIVISGNLWTLIVGITSLSRCLLFPCSNTWIVLPHTTTTMCISRVT